jgi:tight adherence protein B
MSTVGWLALAAALCAVPTGRGTARLAALVRAGRLAAPPQARSPVLPGSVRRVVAPIAAVLLAVTVAASLGLALAAATVVVVATAGVLVRQATVRGATGSADDRHGAALRLLVAELRAGSRPEQALRAAADVDPGGNWWRAVEEIAASGEPATVLVAGGRSAAVGHAWRVAVDTGAPLADVLDRVAADHAAVAGQRRAVTAVLAGPRASAAVLAVLPCVGLGLGMAMGLNPLSTLLHTGAGHLLCCAGAAFDAAGALWTSRIVAGAERGANGSARAVPR